MESQVVAWARRLRAWGLNGFVATLLETGGPVTLMGAQALYAFGPMLTPFAPQAEVTGLARLLEDPQAVRALVDQLHEEPS
jgi:hypothetical protein